MESSTPSSTLTFVRSALAFAAYAGALGLAACSSHDDAAATNTATGGATASGGAATGGSGTGATSSGGGANTGGAASGGAGTGGGPTEPVIGATVPFISYEAEDGTLGGGAEIVALTAPPTTRFSSPELEASHHAYVKLDGTGQYVEWVNETGKDITFINVRVSIPDAPGGKGIDSTLDLLVDGEVRQTIAVTSRQTWGYEGNDHYNAQTQNPSDGNPRTFWDDTHAFILGGAVAPGSTIRLQKNAGNDASFYHLDVVDLEAPPPPDPQPAGSLSIVDYGAKANDAGFDSSAAIQSAIDAAQAQNKTLYIPEGTFYVKSNGGLVAKGITIVGAGMWYSRVYRNVALPSPPLGAIFNLESCVVKNFALDGNAIGRDQGDGAGGGMDTTGENWVADGIWTQHTLSGFWASGKGGTVRNCRLISIWADGCNVNNVALTGKIGENLTVENNFVRGTGDDAIAINSVDYNGDTMYTPMKGVIIRNNTSIAMWGGKGVSVYGGSEHLVEHNYMSDTARYIGLGVGKFGVNGSDLESATVRENVVVRCGGNAYEQEQPALHIGNGGDGQGEGVVKGALVENNTVKDALYNGVGFSTSEDIVLSGNVIDTPGMDGIVVSPAHYPAPTGNASLQGNTVTGLSDGHVAFENLSAGYQVTLDGNSWQ